MRLKRLTCYAFLLTGLLASVTHAEVPVVDSTPVSVDTATDMSSGQTRSNKPVMQEAPQSVSGTAHMMQLMEEMRQEIMTLRGQLEEQTYQINQIKQENRDRYLDLDHRISRFIENGAAPVSAGTTGKASTSTAVANTKTAPKAVAAETSGQEKKAYQAAFALIKDKRFDDALTAMRNLLKDYPRGNYSGNAQYWLGEIQMAQGKYLEAKTEFLTLIDNYPGSAKVADAAYKLGRVYDLLGEKVEAKSRLESVVSQYPGTTAARLSDTYLRNM